MERAVYQLKSQFKLLFTNLATGRPFTASAAFADPTALTPKSAMKEEDEKKIEALEQLLKDKFVEKVSL